MFKFVRIDKYCSIILLVIYLFAAAGNPLAISKLHPFGKSCQSETCSCPTNSKTNGKCCCFNVRPGERCCVPLVKNHKESCCSKKKKTSCCGEKESCCSEDDDYVYTGKIVFLPPPCTPLIEGGHELKVKLHLFQTKFNVKSITHYLEKRYSEEISKLYGITHLPEPPVPIV